MTPKFDPRTEKRLKDLGEKLKRTRERWHLPGVASATLGMHLMNYARIEQGKQNVTVEMLGRIVDGLGSETCPRDRAERTRGSEDPKSTKMKMTS